MILQEFLHLIFNFTFDL